LSQSHRNQPTTQSNNQTIKQPTNKPINQSINQSINQPTNQPTNPITKSTMSDHSQSESESESRANDTSKAAALDNNVDEETLRIMVSTDNHLGYAERDPIRGDDSFAAFEEVLLLAKRHNVSFLIGSSLKFS
jgi:hypothetical protein